MDPITLAMTAIGGLRLLMANPLLGGGSSVRLDQASELLGILGTLLEQGDDALDDLRAFTEEIQAMVDGGRPPTPTEWDNMRARAQSAHDRLQAVKDELLADEGDQSDPQPTPAPEGGPGAIPGVGNAAGATTPMAGAVEGQDDNQQPGGQSE